MRLSLCNRLRARLLARVASKATKHEIDVGIGAAAYPNAAHSRRTRTFELKSLSFCVFLVLERSQHQAHAKRVHFVRNVSRGTYSNSPPVSGRFFRHAERLFIS